MKQVLVELEKCPPESDAFDALMMRVRDEVRQHVKEEEASDGILGRLRKHTPQAELREMATLMRAAKKVAPTRPHPNAPSTPPANILIGAAATIIDRARETLTGRKYYEVNVHIVRALAVPIDFRTRVNAVRGRWLHTTVVETTRPPRSAELQWYRTTGAARAPALGPAGCYDSI